MRKSELSQGIEVFDKHNQTVGTSKVAARKVCLAISLFSWLFASTTELCVSAQFLVGPEKGALAEC